MQNIELINQVICNFFVRNPINQIRAKELMPDFIKMGIFKKNYKDGLPIRKLLRTLYKDNKLYLIPSVHYELKTTNINWYFIRIK